MFVNRKFGIALCCPSRLLCSVLLTVLCGDAITQLTKLPDRSVQMCVTSPPYWGLRDYGCEGQLGLEKTPQEYVANMVQVFREVRRVLKDDGTLWLNLGSSYWGGGRGGNPDESPYRKQATNRGSLIAPTDWNAANGKRPIPSLSREHVPACDTDGIELPDSPVPDSFCCDLCDECRVVLSKGNDCISQPTEQSPPLAETTDRDSEHSVSSSVEAAGVLPDAQESTNPESSEQPQASCSHCANCDACLSVLRSSSRDGSLCARKASYSSGISGRVSASHNQGKDVSDLAYSTIAFSAFKAKDLVNIPFFVAEALRADGWYLRSDIIWHKPNPMPESVTDRPTKSHEYLFLLTKNQRYYYDADSIREPAANPEGFRYESGTWREMQDANRKLGKRRTDGEASFNSVLPNGTSPHFAAHPEGCNKRSVWTVTTQPFRDAHFATFPPDLIKPCILAGSRAGDTVLDPFGGSGTTGMVALELGRKAVLIELNPEYVKLIEQRCDVTPGFAFA